MVGLTKFGDGDSRNRMERGTARFLAVARAADGSLECFAGVVFDRAPLLLSRGGSDGKPVGDSMRTVHAHGADAPREWR
jgi:hypothetical protein